MSRPGRIFRWLIPLAALLAAIGTRHAAASLSGEAAPSNSRLVSADTGTLILQARLDVKYAPTNCPAGTPSSVECYARTGSGTIRGLGDVTESYPYFVDGLPAGCTAGQLRVLPATVRLSVGGKGEIALRVGGSGCLTHVPPNPLRGEATFAVTDGSGRLTGASGSGTIVHESSAPATGRGSDTWAGTLVVPALDFDLSAPIMTGARNRTVRAARGTKRVRVKYAVSARDAVDGAVRVACRPRSGSWFTVGRTRIRCSAADTSGNESRATFIVTVTRAR